MSCYSMTMHQCRSVKSSMFGEPLSPVPGKQLVRWHLMCTDGGSVESYTRRIYKQKYRHAVLDFIVDLNCFHHENSNGQKASLKIADRICASFWSLPASTGYFSSLGKLANVLRMSYWKVRNAWTKQFPQDKNKLRENLMKSVCPKPLAIRWGTVCACEDYVLRLAPADTNFLQAMYLAFPDDFGSDDEPPPGLMSHKQKREQMQGANRAKGSAKGKRRRVGTANRSSGPTNEMQLEAQEHFQATQGKYRRETQKTIRSPTFWQFARISRRCREPWNHLMLFLQSDVTKKHASFHTVLSCLVAGKVGKFEEEIQAPEFRLVLQIPFSSLANLE